jgi:hypothetical protein
VSIDDIPEHFLLPIPFIYQADAQLRSGGAGDVEASFQGRTKKFIQAMVSAGWRKALTAGKTANQGFIYRPEHWEEDEDGYPPVTPKTEEAEDFLLAVQKNERLNYSVKDPETGKDLKTEIMDVLVQEMSGGKVQRFSLSAAARQRDQASGAKDSPLSRSLAGKPQKSQVQAVAGIDPWVPVPDAVVKAAGKQVDPERGDLDIMKSLESAGYQRQKKGKDVVLFNPQHWESAVGGIGLLPLTDEAEMFQDRLGGDAVAGVLPRAMVQKVFGALQALVKKEA